MDKLMPLFSKQSDMLPWQQQAAQVQLTGPADYFGMGRALGYTLGGAFGAFPTESKREQEISFIKQAQAAGMGTSTPKDFRNLADHAQAAGLSGLAGNLYEHSIDLESAQTKTHDIGILREDSKKTIQGILSERLGDPWGPGDIKLPEGVTDDMAINEVWAIHQKYNISINDAVDIYVSAGGVKGPQKTGGAPVATGRPSF